SYTVPEPATLDERANRDSLWSDTPSIEARMHRPSDVGSQPVARRHRAMRSRLSNERRLQKLMTAVSLGFPTSLHSPDTWDTGGTRSFERERDPRTVVPPPPAGRPELALAREAGKRYGSLAIERRVDCGANQFGPGPRDSAPFGQNHVD